MPSYIIEPSEPFRTEVESRVELDRHLERGQQRPLRDLGERVREPDPPEHNRGRDAALLRRAGQGVLPQLLR